MDPSLRRKLVLNLDYGERPYQCSLSTGRANYRSAREQSKRQSGGGGGGDNGGGNSRTPSSRGRGTRNTGFRQTIGADDTNVQTSGSKKRKQPTDADADENEEESAMGRRQPVMTAREQSVGIDVGMSGSGKPLTRSRP